MATKKKRKSRSADEFVRPTAVDRYVGSRVRARRLILGMSQQALAAELGITFQQLQKNEKGTNRIASSRLYQLSNALGVPIQWFFDEMPASISNVGGAEPIAVRGEGADPMARSETLKLVKAYYDIKDKAVRRQVASLARSLADDED